MHQVQPVMWAISTLLHLLEGQAHFGGSLMASKLADSCSRMRVWHPGWQNIAERSMLCQVKRHVKTSGVYLRSVSDLEHALEANALLSDVPCCVLLGGAANITQRPDVALCEANLPRHVCASCNAVLLAYIHDCGIASLSMASDEPTQPNTAANNLQLPNVSKFSANLSTC